MSPPRPHNTPNDSAERRRNALLPSGMIASLTALVLASTGVAAQHAPCDAEVLSRARRGPSGYQERDGNRCEGFYGAKVSGVVLKVVGLTESFTYDPASRTPLTLGWKAPQGADVFLNAQSLKYEVYYQMDARSESPNSYVWDTRMLNSQDLTAEELGAIGYYKHSFGADERNILVPLTGSYSSRPPTSREYKLTIVPNSQLTAMTYSLYKADERGMASGTALIDNVRIRRRRFAEGVPVAITIEKSQLPSAGVYVLEVLATRTNGRETRTPLILFRHPGS